MQNYMLMRIREVVVVTVVSTFVVAACSFFMGGKMVNELRWADGVLDPGMGGAIGCSEMSIKGL